MRFQAERHGRLCLEIDLGGTKHEEEIEEREASESRTHTPPR